MSKISKSRSILPTPAISLTIQSPYAKQTSSVKTVQSNSILSIVLKYPIAKFGNFLYSSTMDKILIVRFSKKASDERISLLG